MLQLKFLMFIFLFSTTVFSQEIGNIKNGNNFIKLLKFEDEFSCVYSDVNAKIGKNNSFNFPNIDTIFSIVMKGFEMVNDHQVIVQTSTDTIVKFEFKKIKGIKMLKIKQNNLRNNIIGISTFFTKTEIEKLFGKPLILIGK